MVSSGFWVLAIVFFSLTVSRGVVFLLRSRRPLVRGPPTWLSGYFVSELSEAQRRNGECEVLAEAR